MHLVECFGLCSAAMLLGSPINFRGIGFCAHIFQTFREFLNIQRAHKCTSLNVHHEGRGPRAAVDEVRRRDAMDRPKVWLVFVLAAGGCWGTLPAHSGPLNARISKSGRQRSDRKKRGSQGPVREGRRKDSSPPACRVFLHQNKAGGTTLKSVLQTRLRAVAKNNARCSYGERDKNAFTRVDKGGLDVFLLTCM